MDVCIFGLARLGLTKDEIEFTLAYPQSVAIVYDTALIHVKNGRDTAEKNGKKKVSAQ